MMARVVRGGRRAAGLFIDRGRIRRPMAEQVDNEREGGMRKSIVVVVGVMMLAVTTRAFAMDVYVTQKGKKYHTAECRWIQNREVTKLNEAKAKEQGYQPCSCVDMVQTPILEKEAGAKTKAK